MSDWGIRFPIPMNLPREIPMELGARLRECLFGNLLQLPRDQWPDDDADLFEVGLDSLRVMRLWVFIEQDLGVALPDSPVTPEAIASVRALIKLIEDHRAIGSGGRAPDVTARHSHSHSAARSSISASRNALATESGTTS
jgi:acyl carrier protein